MVGALPPPKIFGQIVKCNSSTKSAPKQGVVQLTAAFRKQPPHAPFLPQPAQGFRKIDFAPATNFHLIRNQPGGCRSFVFETRAVVKMMTGEKCFLKTAARGSIEPLPLTIMRKLIFRQPAL